MSSVSPDFVPRTQVLPNHKSMCNSSACLPRQGPELFSNEHVRGGSPWGAGTFAGGDGSRQPSEVELAFAKYQARPAALHHCCLEEQCLSTWAKP